MKARPSRARASGPIGAKVVSCAARVCENGERIRGRFLRTLEGRVPVKMAGWCEH